MIVVGTGHRPKKLWNIYDLYHPFYLAVGREVRALLLKDIDNLKEGEFLTIVTGMALGYDTLLALVGLKLKKEFPHKVRIYCAIPCKGHSNRWNKEDKARYQDILNRADVVDYTTEGAYSNYQTMYKRDEFMVDLLDKEEGYVISLWNGFKSGGTYHTIEYAESKGKKIHNINPLKYTHLSNVKSKG